MIDVIDLSQARRRREQKAGQAAHDDGAAFKFARFRFDDEAVGLIEGPLPVCVLLDPDALTGIAMTREDALRLAALLRETASCPEIPEHSTCGTEQR